MGQDYRHFSLDERCQIASLQAQGHSLRQIAAALDRAPSSISRELKRNAGNTSYKPAMPEERARARRWTGSMLDRKEHLRSSVFKALGHGLSPESAKGRYSPAECIGTEKHRIEGSPDPDHVSTSYVERSNLTMRMHNRRFTRLTNAFSKKFESLVHMVAIWAVWYNWVRIHKTLRVAPAMAAGLTDRLWTFEEMIAATDAVAPKPRLRRGNPCGCGSDNR